MSLEERLTEEQKTRILNEVERLRRKVIIHQFYLQGMVHPDRGVREKTSGNLRFLDHLSAEAFVDLFHIGISSPGVTPEIKRKTASSLGALARIDLGAYGKMVQHAISLKDYDISCGVVASLGGIRTPLLSPEQLISSLECRLIECSRENVSAESTALTIIDFIERFVPEITGQETSDLELIAQNDPSRFVEVSKESMMDYIQQFEEVHSRILECIRFFPTLAKADIGEYIRLYRWSMKEWIKCLRDVPGDIPYDIKLKVYRIVERVASSIDVIADMEHDLFVTLCEEGISHDYNPVRIGTAQVIGRVASIDLDSYLKLYKEGIKNHGVRSAIVPTLSSVASVSPSTYVLLFEETFGDSLIRSDLIPTLAALAHSDPNEYECLYRKVMEFAKKDPEREWSNLSQQVVRTLETLPTVDLEMYDRLFHEALTEVGPVARAAAETLRAVAAVNQEKFFSWYHEGLRHADTDVRARTAITLSSLAKVNPSMFIRLYKEGIDSLDSNIQLGTSEAAMALASTLSDREFVQINDNCHLCIVQYLDSEYVRNKSEENVRSELFRVVSLELDYNGFQFTLERGEVNDFDELVECASIHSDYKIIKRLGSGASGTTYKVYSHSLRQERALKVIDQSKVNPKEAELMARIQGKDLENIVQVFDVVDNIVAVSQEKKYAIVMEYVNGPTIDELINKAKQEGKTGIPLDQALHYGAQLLNGIVSLRSYGITHRDLNPRNIKVTTDGVIKILDFGIATEEENPEPRGNRRYGGPSDLFSWGLILYEMITGEHLITPRGENMGTETHAALVLQRKLEIRKDDGYLKEEYRRRIGENVPELVFPYIDRALTSSEALDLDRPLGDFPEHADDLDSEFPISRMQFDLMRATLYKERSLEEFRRDSSPFIKWSELPPIISSMFEASFWEEKIKSPEPEKVGSVLEKCRRLLGVEEYLTLAALLKEEYNPLKRKP